MSHPELTIDDIYAVVESRRKRIGQTLLREDPDELDDIGSELKKYGQWLAAHYEEQEESQCDDN